MLDADRVTRSRGYKLVVGKRATSGGSWFAEAGDAGNHFPVLAWRNAYRNVER